MYESHIDVSSAILSLAWCSDSGVAVTMCLDQFRALHLLALLRDRRPFDAVTMGQDYEMSDYNRSDLIFTRRCCSTPLERTPLRGEGE